MSLAQLKPAAFDQGLAENFAEQIAGTINSGAVTVMMAIGHRAGLFDTLAKMGASTSVDIAEEATLVERYVREWLAVMVTGGIVLYDPSDRTYYLPPEHAACLTRGAPLGNLAVYSQMVSIIGDIQETLLERFEAGGGTCYGDYPCFHQFMAEDTEQSVTAPFFDAILPLAEGLHERLEAGIDVLDAGCARGSTLRALAARYPNSRFVGYDLCDDAIAYGQKAADKEGLSNVRFKTRDLSDYDDVERWDLLLSFDAVHDQKDPQDLLRRYFRALRPGGVYLMQDIGGSAHLENNLDFPMAALLYAASCAHCMPISLGQGGVGLGTMWGWETAQKMLYTAGFAPVERNILPHDPLNVWFVSRKA